MIPFNFVVSLVLIYPGAPVSVSYEYAPTFQRHQLARSSTILPASALLAFPSALSLLRFSREWDYRLPRQEFRLRSTCIGTTRLGQQATPAVLTLTCLGYPSPFLPRFTLSTNAQALQLQTLTSKLVTSVRVDSSCSQLTRFKDVHLHGGASWLYNLFVNSFAGDIKSSIRQSLAGAVRDNVASTVNAYLATVQMDEAIDHTAELQFALIGNPLVTTSRIVTSHDGEVYHINAHSEDPISAPVMPDGVSGRMMEVFVSDYTFNSASFVYFNAGKLFGKLEDKDLPSNFTVRLNTTAMQGLRQSGQRELTSLRCAARAISEVPRPLNCFGRRSRHTPSCLHLRIEWFVGAMAPLSCCRHEHEGPLRAQHLRRSRWGRCN